ncbi:hypothetical protein A3I34_02320 [Candidatus Jorgensenbacteria bacterium RIFCSPLOWO2_02_FULL_45_12]|uniref:Uncharacterized protein n=2 Tax=Candidatus Joergenseniibacteriota TaxID=1752739 RepID=A0A1F6BNU0_9BACT|nr:MAG: Eukaryotic translation initiation factor 5 [Candidatus Jorgensenbacteria bacterium GW2011_GWA2_45_9]OGG38585.1 MAG: hypothetical protein A3D55_01820 [Candidatus Jorgensenbacteria bacterium RIFCSPHIGHO2_02_FULL_45_20]OGG42192.1 MAG: hypothetical protein A3I34_02320 [Candidatus Jorgensenbacteria bacterium RIFCSPLOWO2_02_FULL_45_12]
MKKLLVVLMVFLFSFSALFAGNGKRRPPAKVAKETPTEVKKMTQEDDQKILDSSKLSEKEKRDRQNEDADAKEKKGEKKEKEKNKED